MIYKITLSCCLFSNLNLDSKSTFNFLNKDNIIFVIEFIDQNFVKVLSSKGIGFIFNDVIEKVT